MQWLEDKGEDKGRIAGKTTPELLQMSKKYHIEKKFKVQ